MPAPARKSRLLIDTLALDGMHFGRVAVRRHNNGAYDYAADTRGYTYGLVLEIQRSQLERALPRNADAKGSQWHRP
jgi:hypothetical protein